MALLYCLRQIYSKSPFVVRALHINHGLRGLESIADAKLVEDFCQANGILYDIESLSGFTADSSEEKLRNARYAVFETILDRYPSAKLATAHHLNDQIETYLMRLFMGSGVKGLTGIPLKRDRYIRPFLCVDRRQISDYCARHDIPYREDKSNKDPAKMRNRIRHEIIPVLETLWGRDMIKSFEQSREKMARLYQSYQTVTTPIFKKMLKQDDNGYYCSCNAFLRLDDVQQSGFLDYCFFTIYHLTLSFTINRLNELIKFIGTAASGSNFPVTDSQWILKDRTKFYFTNNARKQTEPAKLFIDRPVDVGKHQISLTTVDAIRYSANPNSEYICGDKIDLPLSIRFWRKGDWFIPFGQSGKQKLSDYFINNKLNVIQKKRVALVVNGDEIVWLAGMRLDARYRVDKNCKTVYMLNIGKKR